MDPSLIPQFLPLRKCVPTTNQVRGQCGQAVIVPHITQVLWCQHNHIVSTVTRIWRAALLGQSFPINGALDVRKWMMARYIICAARCVLLLHIFIVSCVHTNPQPIITNDLMVNFLLVPSLTNRLNLDHPQGVHTGTHKAKMFTRHDAMQLQRLNTRNVGIHSRNRPKFRPFTILKLTLLWLTRGRVTELARRLWEKDKRPAESIEIGAPVFITLVYRLNSHLLSPSAKCPLDLLFSCLHLKQFIKNEWEESKTLRAVRWEGAGDGKRNWKEKKTTSLNTGEDYMTFGKIMFPSA